MCVLKDEGVRNTCRHFNGIVAQSIEKHADDRFESVIVECRLKSCNNFIRVIEAEQMAETCKKAADALAKFNSIT
jgi:hypothetical protein